VAEAFALVAEGAGSMAYTTYISLISSSRLLISCSSGDDRDKVCSIISQCLLGQHGPLPTRSIARHCEAGTE
jgi:hypothetical protein